jgi:hypothetical protein
MEALLDWVQANVWGPDGPRLKGCVGPAVADEAENRNLSVSGYAVAPFLDGVLELFLQQALKFLPPIRNC